MFVLKYGCVFCDIDRECGMKKNKYELVIERNGAC